MTLSADSERVRQVARVGQANLHSFLLATRSSSSGPQIDAETWDLAAYRPVPTVIQAATSIFSGHDVREIANADAENLSNASSRLLSPIPEAKQLKQRYVLMLSGVPGSGKTLAGLNVVHTAIATGVEQAGDIVYLSGNTPLVTVLREALALDRFQQQRRVGDSSPKLADIRREVRARIQHINDFLKDNLQKESFVAPHEHVIVFDEAQRAWDDKHGYEKFRRHASEPQLILEILSRHEDWCVCVCLVGGGQEINDGEYGVTGWSDAIRTVSSDEKSRWQVFAPPDVLHGGGSAGSFALGQLPDNVPVSEELDLQLRVPQRSYRSPRVSEWVDSVIGGHREDARNIVAALATYPVRLSRSLDEARMWLREVRRGERRYGLIASSGARRLRADGLGMLLNASSGDEIAHWYLKPHGDIRSSYALEVPANECTCQGLELDFACVCWGGDLVWSGSAGTWFERKLSGNSWGTIRNEAKRRYLINSYRVMLTRAREGMIIWVPTGDANDGTRSPLEFDTTAEFLESCGAIPL